MEIGNQDARNLFFVLRKLEAQHREAAIVVAGFKRRDGSEIRATKNGINGCQGL